MNRRRALFVGKRVNMHLVRYHKRRIKAQSKVSDNLFCTTLVLIFFNKVRCARKRNLIDVLLYLFCRHAKTIVRKGQRFLFRVCYHINFCLVAIRQGIFSHHVKPLQLGDGVTAVRNHLSVENVMV